MSNKSTIQRFQRLLIILLVIVIAVSSTGLSCSFADEEKKDGKKKETLEERQEKKEKELKKVQDEKDDVYEELNQLAREIEAQEAAIEECKAKIEKKTQQIEKTRKDLEKKKKKIRERKDGLDLRLRTMYKNGVVGYLDIILNSSDVTELITNVDMVQKIYQADQQTLDTLVEERMQIEAKEATLKQEKEELDATKEDLAAKETQLNAANEELKKKYEKLKAEEEKIQAEIQKILADKQLAASLGLEDIPENYKGGKWICPVWRSYYVNRYGEYLAPRSYERHPGIDMSAPTGTDIHAAADGVVVRASWYGGYGNAVVLAHGDGITSLYGHNSSVCCSVGQKVKRGDVIAKMGSTGFSSGSHCHFEVRQNGALRNPRDFCYIHGPNS